MLENLKKEIEENSKNIKDINNKLDKCEDNRLSIKVTYSIVVFLICCLLLLSIDLLISNAPFSISNLLPGIIMLGIGSGVIVVKKIYIVCKKNLRSFTDAKTTKEIDEVELKLLIEKELLINKNNVINRVIKNMNSLKEMKSNLTISELRNDKKNLEEQLKVKEEELKSIISINEEKIKKERLNIALESYYNIRLKIAQDNMTIMDKIMEEHDEYLAKVWKKILEPSKNITKPKVEERKQLKFSDEYLSSVWEDIFEENFEQERNMTLKKTLR